MIGRLEWWRLGPFIAMHFLPLLAFVTGVTWLSIGICAALYVARMFFVTAGFHRYFAHRSYKLNRFWQFVMAFLAQTALQKGILWWAGYHRQHHLHSDTAQDIHSPIRGFLESHVLWVFRKGVFKTRPEWIEDFAKYPELRWLDRNYLVAPILLAVATFLVGGWSGLFVGFFLSTVLLLHGSQVINSFSHLIGRRRYVTGDTSRNSWLLAVITLGEGWHNNHHYYRSSTRQGFYWWEFDPTYYGLKVLSWFGIVKGLRHPPKEILGRNRVKDAEVDVGILLAQRKRAEQMIEKLKQRAGKAAVARRLKAEAFLESTNLAVARFTSRVGIQV